jgi:hypothetical protein
MKQETETAKIPARQRKIPHSSPPGPPDGRILAEGWSMGLYRVREDAPTPRIGAIGRRSLYPLAHRMRSASFSLASM